MKFAWCERIDIFHRLVQFKNYKMIHILIDTLSRTENWPILIVLIPMFSCTSMQSQIVLLIRSMHVSWWRHQMETFPHYWPFVQGIHRSPMNSSHKGQWRGHLIFSLICAWTNGWVNARDTGNLRHHSHYDVTVMMMHEVCVILQSYVQQKMRTAWSAMVENAKRNVDHVKLVSV